MSDLIVIATYPTRMAAEIAQGLLHSASIKSLVSADDAGGLYAFPNQSGFSGVRLLVLQADVQAAQDLLNAPSDLQ